MLASDSSLPGRGQITAQHMMDLALALRRCDPRGGPRGDLFLCSVFRVMDCPAEQELAVLLFAQRASRMLLRATAHDKLMGMVEGIREQEEIRHLQTALYSLLPQAEATSLGTRQTHFRGVSRREGGGNGRLCEHPLHLIQHETLVVIRDPQSYDTVCV